MSTALDLPAISPRLELGAYEALWMRSGATFKTVSEEFQRHPSSLPSDLVPREEAERFSDEALTLAAKGGAADFGIRVHGAGEYPEKLRDARHPVEMLYFQGAWALTESLTVSVVGTRHPSDDAIRRTRRLVKELVANDYTIVSGLAAGVDTAAHQAALEHGGRTIAVLGTSLAETYPKENRELQRKLARDFLVISQVPFVRYSKQNPKVNRFFFPERNKTMSALTSATIIVEAGETSGTLVQAREALHQGRKLFILSSCFENPALTWPARFEKRGAIRVRSSEDILKALAN
jgi:DNA processing protein